jgi:hypothetical protein
MRPLAVLVLVVGLLGAGCTEEPAPAPPAPAPAPPQRHALDWVEPTTEEQPRLVFEVRSFSVLDDGWRAEVAVRNDTDVPWSLGQPDGGSAIPFGVMLFPTGELEELERRNEAGTLPGIRNARAATPVPPRILEPGAGWEGSVSAPGALAAGRWLRVTFGPLSAGATPPRGLPRVLLWITDNTVRLRSDVT